MENTNTNTKYKTTMRTYQDIEKPRRMVDTETHSFIIRQIDAGELESENNTGQREKWWKKKHHPNKEIPLNIYHLGCLNGYISPKELYPKYVAQFGNVIDERKFYNYTRELIKQNIMV